MQRTPPVTRALLVALIAGYIAQSMLGDRWLATLALWPWDLAAAADPELGPLPVGFAPWQLISYAFLHADPIHLFLNGFALWMFGPAIERLLGSRPFAVYWFVCVIGAALSQLATLGWTLPPGVLIPTIGASGGVFGLLLAFGMFYPRERIVLLIPPIPMPAWLFVTLYALLELYLGITGSASGIAHFAHLGGMLAGFVLIQYWRGRLPIRPRRILTR
jgi:membrane associated rhomboid family serine protease